MAIEIEKKYRITPQQRDYVVSELKAAGAEFVGTDNEENTIYGGGILDQKPAIIRIRKTQDKTILTFKQRVANDLAVKEQIEHETVVEDVNAVHKILESLGIEARLVYEKHRDIWKFRSVEVVIDELPFGLYMEIEGSITGIAEAEMILGIENFEVVHETYPLLTARFGEEINGRREARFKASA